MQSHGGWIELTGWLSEHHGQVRLIGTDQSVLKVRDKQVVVGFVTDAESGRLVGLTQWVWSDEEGLDPIARCRLG